jgi:hypothetical protein
VSDPDLEAADAAQEEATQQRDRLKSLYTPDTLRAVIAVQAEALAAGCDAARRATRDGTEPGSGQAAVDLTTAGATDAVLADVPNRWADMVDADLVQAEIERCAADEASIMEAEAQAAAEAAAETEPEDPCASLVAELESSGRAPSSGEVQYLFIECGIDYQG